MKGHGVEEAPCASRHEPGRRTDAAEPTRRGCAAAERVRLGLAQHFARDRRRVAFAERQELQQVDDRVAFGPAEVGVRDLSGLVADVEQQRGDGVRESPG